MLGIYLLRDDNSYEQLLHVASEFLGDRCWLRLPPHQLRDMARHNHRYVSYLLRNLHRHPNRLPHFSLPHAQLGLRTGQKVRLVPSHGTDHGLGTERPENGIFVQIVPCDAFEYVQLDNGGQFHLGEGLCTGYFWDLAGSDLQGLFGSEFVIGVRINEGGILKVTCTRTDWHSICSRYCLLLHDSR